MSEYTPNTEHVRDAYVRAMRNAFIASAGEHEAEFDRWLAEHDAEVRATAWKARGEADAGAVRGTLRAVHESIDAIRALDEE